MKDAETSPISSVFSFFKPTYDFFHKNNEIKAILLSILILRFLPIFLCGFAVFAEILCGFAVSGTPLTPPCELDELSLYYLYTLLIEYAGCSLG